MTRWHNVKTMKTILEKMILCSWEATTWCLTRHHMLHWKIKSLNVNRVNKVIYWNVLHIKRLKRGKFNQGAWRIGWMNILKPTSLRSVIKAYRKAKKGVSVTRGWKKRQITKINKRLYIEDWLLYLMPLIT